MPEPENRGWTRIPDLHARLQKEWDKGHLLAAALTGETLFPLRLPLKHPNQRRLSEDFAAARDWIAHLNTDRGYELEWRDINHRQLGKNRLPIAAVFPTETAALAFLGKQREAKKFRQLSERILAAFPPLRDWLIRKPLLALAAHEQWPRLLAVMEWLQSHPAPRIYLRQLEIPEVDTKFIEHNKKLLGELLDIVLPRDAIDQSATGVSGFEQRYGFRSKPVQIRFRLLDPALYIQGLSDLAIPAEEFAGLNPPAQHLFITENDINGLAFPPLSKSLVIFGLGYGLDRLTDAGWIAGKNIYYWGDIDTHGFAMLNQLRRYFPRARSLLMDRDTLMQHQAVWGTEPKPARRELSRLTDEETELYDNIRRDHLAPALRLEQERINYRFFKAALFKLGFDCGHPGEQAGINGVSK